MVDMKMTVVASVPVVPVTDSADAADEYGIVVGSGKDGFVTVIAGPRAEPEYGRSGSREL